MKKLLIIAVFLLTLLTSVANAADFALSVQTDTATTITFTWSKQAGIAGYYFYSGDGCNQVPTTNCNLVSQTFDPNRTSVRFAKQATYRVSAFVATPGGSGTYPIVTTPPPPPPPVGNGSVVTVSGTITPAQLTNAINSVSGPVTVVGPATVNGYVSINKAGVTLSKLAMGTFEVYGSDFTFTNGSANRFNVFGADNVTIQNSSFDGAGGQAQNIIWDVPAGNGTTGLTIKNNTFKNYYTSNPGDHYEALYVGGYTRNGVIEGNTFTNNGNTAHIFFTWFGTAANPPASNPSNICVRGNTFGPTHGAYFSVNFRAEIPAEANISVNPKQSTVAALSTNYVRSC